MKHLILGAAALTLLSGCSLFEEKIDLNDPQYNKTGSVEYLTTVEYLKIAEVEPFTFVVTNDANQVVFRKDNTKYVYWRPQATGLYTATVYYKAKQPDIAVIYNPPQGRNAANDAAAAAESDDDNN